MWPLVLAPTVDLSAAARRLGDALGQVLARAPGIELGQQRAQHALGLAQPLVEDGLLAVEPPHLVHQGSHVPRLQRRLS